MPSRAAKNAGRTRLDWRRRDAPDGDTDIVEAFTIELDQKHFDVTAMMDNEPKFIAGPTTGTLRLEIYNCTVPWVECLSTGEEIPYVLPDVNHTTVIGIVKSVDELAPQAGFRKTVVEMIILKVVS